jgi:hypothetical protein
VADRVAALFGEDRERRRAAVRAIAAGAVDEPGASQFARGTGQQAPELEPEYAELSVSWHGETPTGRRRNHAWPVPVLAIGAVVSAAVIALSIYPPGSKEPASAAPVGWRPSRPHRPSRRPCRSRRRRPAFRAGGPAAVGRQAGGARTGRPSTWVRGSRRIWAPRDDSRLAWQPSVGWSRTSPADTVTRPA